MPQLLQVPGAPLVCPFLALRGELLTPGLTGAAPLPRPMQRQSVSKPSTEGLTLFPATVRLHGNYAFPIELPMETLPARPHGE
jgi:hypothetical protein